MIADVNDPKHELVVDDVTTFLESVGMITIPYGVERWLDSLKEHTGFFTGWDWLAKFERSRPDGFAWCPTCEFGFYYDGKTGAISNGVFNVEAIPLARSQVIGLPTLFVHCEFEGDSVTHEGALFAGVWPSGWWGEIKVLRLNYPRDSYDRSGLAARSFLHKLRPQYTNMNVEVSRNASGDPYCRIHTNSMVEDWRAEVQSQLNVGRPILI